MIITVTQEHVRAGKMNDCVECPIALAIREQTGYRAVVGPERVELFVDDVGSTMLDLPAPARAFIRTYDHSGEGTVVPFEFCLPIAMSALRLSIRVTMEGSGIASEDFPVQASRIGFVRENHWHPSIDMTMRTMDNIESFLRKHRGECYPSWIHLIVTEYCDEQAFAGEFMDFDELHAGQGDVVARWVLLVDGMPATSWDQVQRIVRVMTGAQ